MHIKQTIKIVLKKIHHLNIWIKLLLVGAIIVVCYPLITFMQVKTVQFSYGQPTCVPYLTFLPSTNKQVGNSGFDVSSEDVFKISGVSLLSFKTCFSAKTAPVVGDVKVRVAMLGGWFMPKNFELSVSTPPGLDLSVLKLPVPTSKPLKIDLDNSDLIYSYQLKVDGKVVNCPVKDAVVSCDIASLNLLQGKKYDIELNRLFNQQKVQTIISQSVTTLNAATIVSSSIGSGQMVYDSPKNFIFTFDKDVIGGRIILEKVEGDKRTPAPVTTSFTNKQATATIADDLSRNATYEFTIDNIVAKDTSTLVEPYKLRFNVSDGPNVSSVSVGDYELPLSQTIYLTFDSLISETQDITRLVTVSGISASISKSGNQVFVQYANAPYCTDFSINIKPGLLSNYGIIQNDSWSFSTRTVCHSTSTIGYSGEGRPILAYTFGSGGQTVLYVGNIHGNERSTKYLMDAWVDELELSVRSIPADKTIIVISSLNPDGFAADGRNNSNNVDLNRNFPVSDWQTDIVDPANQPILGGGGATALSEPESQAIANFTLQLYPRLTVSFHGNAGYAIGNDFGDSANLASQYSNLTGYRDMTGDSGAFSYPITGTYDDWLRETCGLTSVVVELSSNTNSQFNINKAALWAMARS